MKSGSHGAFTPLGAGLLLALLVSCGASSDSDGAAAYFPTATGMAWTYTVTPPGGAPYTDSVQITQGSPLSVVKKNTTSNNAVTYTLATYELRSTGVGESSYLLYRISDNVMVGGYLYSPPSLIIPANTAAGSATSVTSMATQQNAMGAPANYSSTRDATLSSESVTVAAGTFSALKVTTHISNSNGYDGYNVQWYAPGVGSVKIVNYATATPTATTTWELTSHTP
jgi:DUF3108-like